VGRWCQQAMIMYCEEIEKSPGYEDIVIASFRHIENVCTENLPIRLCQCKFLEQYLLNNFLIITEPRASSRNLPAGSVRRYSANTWTRGAIEGHCSLTPLQITLEIRCWTIQYRTIIEKGFCNR